MKDSRDLRDPAALGSYLRKTAIAQSRTVCDVYDGDEAWLRSCPVVAEADGVYVGPLQRYGDPRA